MKWLMRGKTLRVTMARGSDKPHADLDHSEIANLPGIVRKPPVMREDMC